MDSASPVEFQVQCASSSAAVQSPRATACPHLSPSIWQKLPDELLEIVFTKLPISALKKFSRLSKRWRVFIHSEEFAHRCDSTQLTAVYFDPHANNRSVPHLYTALPGPKTESWKEHFLKFIAEDESLENLLAADQGLLCYRVRNKWSRLWESSNEIVLVVHNPFTQKWRRLVVPYTPETETGMRAIVFRNNMLVGLCVDKKKGSYKLVVAFIDSELTRTTFVYNSPSASWTTSAAVFPGLEQRVEISEWDIQQSICSAGEVYWLVEESDKKMMCDDERPHFKSLIKYSMKLDIWSVATQQWPCEKACHLHLVSFENRLILVNFDDVSEERLLFPEEFSILVPDLVNFDAQAFRDVMNKAVYIHGDEDYLGRNNFLPKKAAAEGSALFVHSEHDDVPDRNDLEDINNLEVILGFNRDSPKVIRLPVLEELDFGMVPFLLTFTLKAFV